jgi:hypothetical protein
MFLTEHAGADLLPPGPPYLQKIFEIDREIFLIGKYL